jgi:hypothetical protein
MQGYGRFCDLLFYSEALPVARALIAVLPGLFDPVPARRVMGALVRPCRSRPAERLILLLATATICSQTVQV